MVYNVINFYIKPYYNGSNCLYPTYGKCIYQTLKHCMILNVGKTIINGIVYRVYNIPQKYIPIVEYPNYIPYITIYNKYNVSKTIINGLYHL